MGWLRDWRRRRILAGARIDEALWRRTLEALPLLGGMSAAELDRLRALTLLFLHEKALEPVGEAVVTDGMRLRIGCLAALPVLNLGLDWYRNWHSVVVYPSGFRARRQHIDEASVVHDYEEDLVGEAWERGPVLLSWEEVEASTALDGFNVAIHEFAHKLDMLTGHPNGLPPLHRDMRVEAWSEAFGTAFADLERRLAADEETAIDPYAAEDPAEFFAVLSEAFFEQPRLVKEVYPEVYGQLHAFYRQDPARRLPPGSV
jgi:Mlc titration factor MtfA (ptsG expression regulator)